jgi:recombination protein RecA
MLWTKEQINYLKENFPIKKDQEVAEFLGKSPNAVRIQASRLNIKKQSSIIRNNLTLSPEEEQVILGGILGDLHCTIKKPTSINACLEGAHCHRQVDYLYWKLDLLSNLVFNTRETKHNSLYFESKNYKCLNYYRDLFYHSGKKKVNEQILKKIDKLGMLIWYLDDGSYRRRDRMAVLYTNCFSLPEQNLIQSWFQERWGIDCRIYKATENQFYLGFPVKDTKRLFSLFSEFDVPQCMRYKIDTPALEA